MRADNSCDSWADRAEAAFADVNAFNTLVQSLLFLAGATSVEIAYVQETVRKTVWPGPAIHCAPSQGAGEYRATVNEVGGESKEFRCYSLSDAWGLVLDHLRAKAKPRLLGVWARELEDPRPRDEA